MPDQPRKPPKIAPPDNFASFDPLSRGRRKPQWSLHPTREQTGNATADAGRFITEAELMQGLGRRKQE